MTKTTLFALLLFVSQRTLQGQTDSSAVLLEETTIHAGRIQLSFSEENRTIQVLSRSQLQAMPIRTVAEALQSVAGIDVRQRGPLGIQADLHVRGGGFDQVLVLLNGVRLSDPQTGHHILNLPVDWSAISRIEVLKGPGARIYGQNAFACAVNIITSVPSERAFKAGIAGGDFGFLSANAYASLPKGRLRQHVAMSRDASEGYRSNTDFQVFNAFYQASLEDKNGQGQWNLLADWNQRAFGANGYYGRLEFTDQYEEVQTNVISLAYTRQALGRWTLKPRVAWRRNQDWYDFQRTNPANAVNFHLSQVASAECNASARWVNGQQTGLGLNAEYTSLTSSRLGIRSRTTLNLFAEHRFSFLRDRINVVPGISVSHFSDFGTFVYPGLDAGLRLTPNWCVYANAGYNYRIPTFTDLYYEDAGNKGNPDLQPERAFSLETGVKYQGKNPRHSMQLALFRRDGRNLIDWTKENEADKWQTRNFNTVLMQGLEWSGELFFPGNNGPAHLTLAYTLLDAQVSDQVAFSRYALNHLRHQVNAGFDYRIWRNLRHSLRARWCDRVVQNAATKSDYAVLDTKIWYETRRIMVFAEAINALDATYGEIRYSDTAVLTMPGRWFRTGVEVRW